MNGINLSDAELAHWLEQKRKRALEPVTNEQLSVKALKHALKAIALEKFPYPFVWDEKKRLLFVRTESMAALQTDETEREWGGRVSGRCVKTHLHLLGLLQADEQGQAQTFEKTVDAGRVGHMVGIKLNEATNLIATELQLTASKPAE